MDSSGPVKIAVDAMGGDFAPASVVQGAVEASRLHGLAPILVGREDELVRELVRVGSSRSKMGSCFSITFRSSSA